MLNQKTMEQIKKVLSYGIQNQEIAGANMLVIKDGKEIFYHEAGLADREAEMPIQRDSIFRLYSLSKPVTATAIMMLLERGEIDLYEPVSHYLEGFKNQVVDDGGLLVPVEREVTLKDLLSMTSGLVYGGEQNRSAQETQALFEEVDRRLFSKAPMSTMEVANNLGRIPLTFQPGTRWEYGTSADVLGAVVEVVSGQRFSSFLEREIFQPLKMRDTGFWLPKEKRNRLVKAYAEDGNGGLTLYSGNHLGIVNQMDRIPAFESGGAGLVSTIDDVTKFTKMLMNGGTLDEVQILHPKTVEFLTSATLNPSQHQSFNEYHLSGYSYGNQMRVMTEPTNAGILGSIGEYGWDGWLGAYFCNCPKDDLTFLFMTQKTDAGTTPLTRKLRNIVLGNL